MSAAENCAKIREIFLISLLKKKYQYNFRDTHFGLKKKSNVAKKLYYI